MGITDVFPSPVGRSSASRDFPFNEVFEQPPLPLKRIVIGQGIKELMEVLASERSRNSFVKFHIFTVSVTLHNRFFPLV